MMASTTRKMHVPAYAPELVGVHAEEKSGVSCAVVKTMDMPLLMVELLLEELLDMPLMSIVAAGCLSYEVVEGLLRTCERECPQKPLVPSGSSERCTR